MDYILDNAVNDPAKKLSDDIIEAAGKNIPYRMVKIRPQDSPWMTSHIKKLIRRRKRLHRKVKQSQNSEHLWHQFRQARNQCVNSIQNAKKEHFQKQVNLLENSETCIKNWCKTLRNLSGISSKKSDYPPMFVDNEYIEDNKKKADAFNIFFVTRQWLTILMLTFLI